jgi:hypothetical protein
VTAPIATSLQQIYAEDFKEVRHRNSNALEELRFFLPHCNSRKSIVISSLIVKTLHATRGRGRVPSRYEPHNERPVLNSLTMK